MSSSGGKYYKKAHYGSHYYKRKGILGNLFNLFSSDRNAHGHHDERYYDPQNGTNRPNQLLTCPKCSSQIPLNAKFCSECGEKVNDALYCNSCGEKLPPDSKFCSKCGAKLNK